MEEEEEQEVEQEDLIPCRVTLIEMGHHSCCNQQKVKRGLWSPEEDEKLTRYITTHGYGCWSEVPEKAGPRAYN